jgi:prephenate dehydrogenase
MTIKLTIVGLGQIGGSIGLALSDQTPKIIRVGHDKDVKVARQAEKAGAVDKVAINLISAVTDADIVILAIPMDQIQETLKLIATDLKHGTVVMDTGPVKELVVNWASEFLPEGRYYVGITPVLNPDYLHTTESGFYAARSDLFHEGLIAIVTPPGTPSDAIKLATDLTIFLGASPFFADILEIDGLIAATHLLPQIMAASLVNATIDQPGWREARKIAGRHYAATTSSLLADQEIKSLGAASILGKKNVVRVLDDLIMVLQSFRESIESEDTSALEGLLDHAIHGRAQWWVQRQSANWKEEELPASEMPSSGDMLGRLVGIRRKPKEKK